MKKTASLIILFMMLFNIAYPAFSMTKTEENDYLKIERKSRHLHSRLSKKYTGYEYTIKNIYNEPVTIENVSIWDNASDKVAYLSVKRLGVRASAETLAAGAALALPTLTLSLIGAVIAVPFVIVSNAAGNVGANQEAKRFDKQATLPAEIPVGSYIEFKTMALHNHHPSARVTFKNPITDENMNLELK